MKTRFIWLVFGLAFFVTLAVIVGQRLSAEAMAVIVGVVAGVAASIPTSLIIVWVTARSMGPRAEAPVPPPAEPRIVVMAPPMSGTQMGYGAVGPMTLSAYAPAPRRFTVIGGADTVFEETPAAQEGVWPQ